MKKYEIVTKLIKDVTVTDTSNIIPLIDSVFNLGDASFYHTFFERNDLMMYAFGKAYPPQEGPNKYIFAIILYQIKSESTSLCSLNSHHLENIDDDIEEQDEFDTLQFRLSNNRVTRDIKSPKFSKLPAYDKIADLSPLFKNLRTSPYNYKKCMLVY